MHQSSSHQKFFLHQANFSHSSYIKSGFVGMSMRRCIRASLFSSSSYKTGNNGQILDFKVSKEAF